MALSLNNVLIMSCLFVFRSSYNSKFNKVEKYSLIILVREFIHWNAVHIKLRFFLAFVCYWYLWYFFILGPCALDEIFFPYSSNSEKAIGSCFNIKSKGKVTYNEVDDVCLAEYGKGSKRSPFSKRDQEYRLLEGMISFFEQRPLR